MINIMERRKKKDQIKIKYTKYERALELVEAVQFLGEDILSNPFVSPFEKLEILMGYRENNGEERGIRIGSGRDPVYFGPGKNYLTYNEVQELLDENDSKTKLQVNNVLASYYNQALRIIGEVERKRKKDLEEYTSRYQSEQYDLFPDMFSMSHSDDGSLDERVLFRRR